MPIPKELKIQLNNYKKIKNRDELDNLALGTNIRYFYNDNQKLHEGRLHRIDDDYILLVTPGCKFSVQLDDNLMIFYEDRKQLDKLLLKLEFIKNKLNNYRNIDVEKEDKNMLNQILEKVDIVDASEMEIYIKNKFPELKTCKMLNKNDIKINMLITLITLDLNKKLLNGFVREIFVDNNIKKIKLYNWEKKTSWIIVVGKYYFFESNRINIKYIKIGNKKINIEQYN